MARFQIAGHNAADWAASNPVLLDREYAAERDTGKFKLGDGTTAWNSLAYVNFWSSFAQIVGAVTDNAALVTAFGAKVSTSSLASGIATFLGTPSSANLAATVTDETGSGKLVFATSPTLVAPVLGAATGTSFIPGTSSATFASTAQARYFYNSSFGCVFGGAGSVLDMLAVNAAGSTLFSVATGTQNVDFGGNITITNTTTASAANVFQSGSGTALLRSTSSRDYKRDIERLDPARADALLSLRPVWYRSKAEADNPDWGWYGFIAEEVAKVDPRLVHWAYRDEDYYMRGRIRYLRKGAKLRPDGVQYERVVVGLLDVVQRLEARLARLESERT